jgi:YesN/AraC family two-component response regulator
MKQLIALLIIGLLIIPGIAAAGSGIHEPGTGLETGSAGLQGNASALGMTEQVSQETQNAGENETLQIQQEENVRARNVTELQAAIQERKMVMEQERLNASIASQGVLKNQNQVRLAVYALIAAENRTGGIGQNVSAIAREFNNSVRQTIQAEEQIQARSGLMRFLLGGNMTAARILEQETLQNQERIMELNMLIANCTCDDETRALLQEQVQTIEQEQVRLQILAQQEKKDRGIFGWFWK